MRRCCFLLSALLAFAASANPTHAQLSDNVVRIGVLNDGSGPYADLAGRGSVIAAQIAIEEHGGKALGKPIEVISADHQLKPDVAILRSYVGGSIWRELILLSISYTPRLRWRRSNLPASGTEL